MDNGENMQLKPKALETVAAQTGESKRGEAGMESFKTLSELLDGVLTRLGNLVSERKNGAGALGSATGTEFALRRAWEARRSPYIRKAEATRKRDAPWSRK